MQKRKTITDWVKPTRFLRSLIILGAALCLITVPSRPAQNREVRVTEFKLFSQVLNEERTLSIALPDTYETSLQEYPVLYVLDAEGTKVFPDSLSTVEKLNQEGKAPQMILVGISNTNRNRDMIPSVVTHRPGSGGSDKFLAFLEEELIPYIHNSCRANNYSLLYGMSNSALFSVYAMFESRDTFDAVIASSPMIGHCPEYIKNSANAFVKSEAVSKRILYMIYGTEDSQSVTDFVPELQNYLKSFSIENFISELVILEGEGHVPKSSLSKGLEFIFSQIEK